MLNSLNFSDLSTFLDYSKAHGLFSTLTDDQLTSLYKSMFECQPIAQSFLNSSSLVPDYQYTL